MQVRDELVQKWMSTRVVTCPPTAKLPDLYKLMIKYDIRRIPIMTEPETDDEMPQLLGIVTHGDVRSAEPSTITSLGMWEMRYVAARMTADKFMTPDPITIAPTATIGEAARKMLTNKVSGLPVVDGKGQLVGILTESDIFRMVTAYEWQQGEVVAV
ncbi:MAG: CBS domain-containing protein [Anaerolineales bacterium]|nr:CBS domain-containing protein [Anaerolineales bacterium]